MAQAPMKYEYTTCSQNLTPEQITEQFGAYGWEMCGVNTPFLYFKRVIPELEPIAVDAALQKNYSPKE